MQPLSHPIQMLVTKNYLQFKVVDPLSSETIQEFEGAAKANRALPEDKVAISESGQLQLIERSPKKPLVGILGLTSKYMYGMTGHGVPLYFCEPLNPGYPPFRIACKEKDRSQNLLVSFQFESWEAGSEMPRGSLLEILGPSGDFRTEQKALAILSCPWKAPKPLSPLPPCNSTERILLSQGTFNIDPLGCRDIDDVLTLQQVNDDQWTLWITIADVSEWVVPGEKTFLTARNIGATSYQQGVAVRPMLHPELSEAACSLIPGETRYGLSLRIQYSQTQNTIIGTPEFKKTIVVNQESYTYESILKSKTVPLSVLEAISGCLGTPSSDPHKWIESCMVYYNQCAAKVLLASGSGLLRKHDAPFQEQQTRLMAIDPTLEFLAYQSAKYCPATESEGHWGLKLSAYCHATSPIRRFADLVNQRVLKLVLDGVETSESQAQWLELAHWLNCRQKQIQEAERNFTFLKAVDKSESSEVDGIFLYERNQKFVFWVEEWQMTVNIQAAQAQAQAPEPGTHHKISYFCDRSRAKWKERIILRLS